MYHRLIHKATPQTSATAGSGSEAIVLSGIYTENPLDHHALLGKARMSMNRKPRVLVADDEETIQRLLEHNLKKAGYQVLLAGHGAAAIKLANEDLCCALVDLKMPEMDGLAVLNHFKRECPEVPVIMMSAVGQVRDAVGAMKQGAFEYLAKPFDLDELLALTASACRYSEALRERKELKDVVFRPPPDTELIGQSPALQKLRTAIKRIANLDAAVLITGESGTGKSLIARLIHRESDRRHHPFITTSCPTLPRELLESEMFGHERGAFTGAHQRRIGRLELAENGTLFLDEIGDLPLLLQPKLLNVLQDRQYQRVGGSMTLDANVRIIAATNSDLKTKVANREFREDLFYRLNVFELHIPSLRERKADIPSLAQHILERIASSRKSTTQELSREALASLMAHDWPGNIRQLENVLERSSAFCTQQTIGIDELPSEITGNSPATDSSPAEASPAPQVGGLSLEELEKLALQQTLQLHNGNKAAAARSLGITEKSIYNKLTRFGLR